MDATFSEDNNSGGIVDAIVITRNDTYRAADYTLDTTTSGNAVSLVSGQIVSITTTGAMNTGVASGVGAYTYTGATTITGKLGALNYSGGLASGFLYQGVGYGNQPAVTFAFYLVRGTTTPIPASGDYRLMFSKTVPANTASVDCSDVMLPVAYPMPAAGNTSFLGTTSPLSNKGVYLVS